MERSNSLQPPAHSPWHAIECQAFDQHLQSMGLPASCLMEQAARSITEFLTSVAKPPLSSIILFLCGPGNNGADAVAAARQLLGHPYLRPAIYLPGGSPSPESLLSLQYQAFKNLGGSEIPDLNSTLKSPDCASVIVVDGLFGVGLARPVGGEYAKALLEIEKSALPVLAVDCPSGLDCDTGKALGSSLPAKWTISFIGAKYGFELEQGPHLCGEIRIADIGVRRELADRWLEQHRNSSQR